jgi:hypothetical protein
VKEH